MTAVKSFEFATILLGDGHKIVLIRSFTILPNTAVSPGLRRYRVQ